MHIPQRFFGRKPAAWAATALALLASGAAWAVDPFVLKDIRVEGLQRADAGTVFSALPFRIGDTYTDEKGASALRALFATGLFKDVRVEVKGDVVVVMVEERPTVGAVEFSGLKEFDKDQLSKSLKDFGIAEGRPFDKSIVDRAEQEIKRQYLSRSLYGAEVVTTVTPADRNRVNLTFSVVEGSTAKIREIHITGNKAFSESELVTMLELQTSGWLSWYNKNDQYSRTKLNADIETLRSHYMNHGYLEFQVTNTQVSITPDKQQIAIQMQVNEGPRYAVTGVRLEGNFLGRDELFKSQVIVKPGSAFRQEDLAATEKAFRELFGSFGYAFAQVESRPEINRATGTAEIVISVNPSRRVYVRRFNIAGNTKTRDEVIRREFRQLESAWYDGDKIRRSKERVEYLGYFEKDEVQIDTVEVPGTLDQVDLIMTVKEKSTGTFTVGAGFSQYERWSFNASLRQDNVFGSGNFVSIDLNTSKFAKQVALSSEDPYWTEDGVSRRYELSYLSQRPNTLYTGNLFDYKLLQPSARVRFGIPITERDRIYVGAGVESTRIDGATATLPFYYAQYRDRYGARTVTVPLSVGWAQDSRDNLFTPSRGTLRSIAGEWSVAGDARYAIVTGQWQQYFPLTRRLSLMLNGQFGWATGMGGRELPVFKNFKAGGLGSVRAFATDSLGPVDMSGQLVGGTRKLNFNSELYLPVPGSGNDKSLRIFLFGDAGYVWGHYEPVRLKDLRASAGLGVSWMSPMGPLRLSYGTPVRSLAGDRIERLQFQVGNVF